MLPFASTVTVICASFSDGASSFTVIIAVPIPVDVITILPSTNCAVATFSSLVVTAVPTIPTASGSCWLASTLLFAVTVCGTNRLLLSPPVHGGVGVVLGTDGSGVGFGVVGLTTSDVSVTLPTEGLPPVGTFTASSTAILSGLISLSIELSIGVISWLPYCCVSTDGNCALFSKVTLIGVSITKLSVCNVPFRRTSWLPLKLICSILPSISILETLSPTWTFDVALSVMIFVSSRFTTSSFTVVFVSLIIDSCSRFDSPSTMRRPFKSRPFSSIWCWSPFLIVISPIIFASASLI